MEQHLCGKEAEISQMMTIMTGIVKEHYGNGREGIAKTVPKLEQAIQTLNTTICAQTVVISDLVKFQASLTAVDHYKDKEGFSSRQRAGLWISGILGFTSVTTALIIKFA
jgi:hypothetical protein